MARPILGAALGAARTAARAVGRAALGRPIVGPGPDGTRLLGPRGGGPIGTGRIAGIIRGR
jgi:hypothetical protein